MPDFCGLGRILFRVAAEAKWLPILIPAAAAALRPKNCRLFTREQNLDDLVEEGRFESVFIRHNYFSERFGREMRPSLFVQFRQRDIWLEYVKTLRRMPVGLFLHVKGRILT